MLVALVAAGAGLLAATVFALHHFTGEGCGLVRFYERLVGISVLGAWLLGSVAGFALVMYGRRRAARCVWPGTAITVLANAAMLTIALGTVRAAWAADYARKSTELLIRLVESGTLDEQKYAALELGNRRVAGAVPLLCAVAEDGRSDINLRFIAVAALGKICTPSEAGTAVDERAVAALVHTLSAAEEFLPDEACHALTAMKATSAVEPLTRLLNDAARPTETREAAARALVSIAGPGARDILQAARANCRDEHLAVALDRLLFNHP
ncbi:MAG TPA: HEAT repeat domain-containing protein [Phycisphaerae bacterium]|nr:HEAT repeat domain-containing protein [Phycisphaerae bacterium]